MVECWPSICKILHSVSNTWGDRALANEWGSVKKQMFRLAQLVQCLHKALGSIPNITQTGFSATGVWKQEGQHFKVILSYTASPGLLKRACVAGAMSQWAKLSKHENPSSDPLPPHKKLDMAEPACNPISVGEGMETGRSQGLLVSSKFPK